MRITTEETGNKGGKYYDGDRKMDTIWLKVRITTKETGKCTIETGTGTLATGIRTLETGKKNRGWVYRILNF